MEPEKTANNSLLRRDLAKLQDGATDFEQFQQNVKAYHLAQITGMSVGDALAQIQAVDLP